MCVCVCERERERERDIYIYLGYYSAVIKKEILPSGTTGMNLEDIMLSERSQAERQIMYGLTYTWDFKM